jgi:hypothetical protein
MAFSRTCTFIYIGFVALLDRIQSSFSSITISTEQLTDIISEETTALLLKSQTGELGNNEHINDQMTNALDDLGPIVYSFIKRALAVDFKDHSLFRFSTTRGTIRCYG